MSSPESGPVERATHHVEADVLIDAPARAVFDAFTDWATQGQWMLGTDVTVTQGDGRSVGSGLAAFTGVVLPGGLRLGFLDTMTITDWDEPVAVRVLHTGRIVRGTGAFEVFELPLGRSRFVWSEELELPLGRLGVLGWSLVKPVFLVGLRRSLDVFARAVGSGQSLGVPAA